LNDFKKDGALTVNNFYVILYDISKGQNSSQAEKFQVETSQLKILLPNQIK
jgi:hypothetical protein